MAFGKNKYGANAGRNRKAPPEPGTPKGVLYPVLIDYWMTFSDNFSNLTSPIVRAKAGSGFHVMRGQGCDATIGKSTGDRCGEKACSRFAYVHSEGGVILGVRVCTEHVNIATEEDSWKRTVASLDDFSVWEVMTA